MTVFIKQYNLRNNNNFIQILYKNLKRENISNYFEDSINLIPKSYNHIIRNENYRWISFMNIYVKNSEQNISKLNETIYICIMTK